jgi:hypothetical protein
MLDEIFRAEHSVITVKNIAGLAKEEMSSVTDFVLWYAKDHAKVKERRRFIEKHVKTTLRMRLLSFLAGRERDCRRKRSVSRKVVSQEAASIDSKH